MYADESKMVAIVLVCLAILVALVMILICYFVARRSKCQKLRSSQSACATSAVSGVYTSFTGVVRLDHWTYIIDVTRLCAAINSR